jgi:hypothetical protein
MLQFHCERKGGHTERIDGRSGKRVDVGLRVQQAGCCGGEGETGVEGDLEDSAVPRAGISAQRTHESRQSGETPLLLRAGWGGGRLRV